MGSLKAGGAVSLARNIGWYIVFLIVKSMWKFLLHTAITTTNRGEFNYRKFSKKWLLTLTEMASDHLRDLTST